MHPFDTGQACRRRVGNGKYEEEKKREGREDIKVMAQAIYRAALVQA